MATVTERGRQEVVGGGGMVCVPHLAMCVGVDGGCGWCHVSP